MYSIYWFLLLSLNCADLFVPRLTDDLNPTCVRTARGG